MNQFHKPSDDFKPARLEGMVESVLFRYVNLAINRGLKEGGCGCPSCFRDAVSITEWYLRLDNVKEEGLKRHLKDYVQDYENIFDENYKFVYERYLKLTAEPKQIDWGDEDITSRLDC